MAHTKQGRDKKAREDANRAERRVLESDLDAFRSPAAEPDLYDDADLDEKTMAAYGLDRAESDDD